ncbi:MAG: hypothetical protein ABI748_03360 [Dokdonella sp.]
MNKDKLHKKDKSKKHDLFSLMLEQSEVFRDMVAHFQSVWAPKMFSNKHDEVASAAPASKKAIAKNSTRTAKAERKHAAKAPPAAKKVATAAKNGGIKMMPGAKSSKPVVAKKSDVKAVQQSAKKRSPKR